MLRKLSLSEIREIQLNMMDYIDRICRENQIEYSLAYGTLIGAVRHSGFIPWDDDLDIFMTRNHYEKFLKLMKDSSVNRHPYRVINYEEAFFPWTKVIDSRTVVMEREDYGIKDYGIWIDVFPYDHVPDPAGIESNKFRKKLDLYNRLGTYRALSMRHAQNRKLPYKMAFGIIKLGLSVFPINYFGKKWNSFAQTYNNIQTGFLGFSAIYSQAHSAFNETLFNDYIEMEFEDRKYLCIKGYDYYLSTVYGDYMKLPPKNEQYPKHLYEAFIY